LSYFTHKNVIAFVLATHTSMMAWSQRRGQVVEIPSCEQPCRQQIDTIMQEHDNV